MPRAIYSIKQSLELLMLQQANSIFIVLISLSAYSKAVQLLWVGTPVIKLK